MTAIELEVYGTPQPAGSKTAGRTNYGRSFVRDASPSTREWKRQVAQAAGQAMRGRPLLDGPIQLDLCFYRPRPKSHHGKHGVRPSAPAMPTTKPDSLKLARAVEDALSGICYRDDAQICHHQIRKQYGEPARVLIRITPIGGAP